MDHKGTRRLETERLILRPFAMDDVHATYANWCSDPEVARYTTWPAHADEGVTRALLEDWTARYDRPDYYNWVLELKNTGEAIGNCSVVRLNEDIDEAELGWCMSRREWGKGYMPEAAREIARFLFDEVGANRVCAKHDVENPKSGRVMQKIGMRFEGVRRQGFRGTSGLKDVACYAMLKSDREETA